MRTVRYSLLCLLVPAALLAADTAQDLYRDAKRAEKKGDIVRAYTLYTHASALDPSNAEYAGKSLSLRTSALTSAKIAQPSGALPLPDPAPPVPAEMAITPKDLDEMKRLLPPPALAPSKERRDLKLNGPPRKLIEDVLKAYGYDAIFDTDYPESGSPQAFVLTGADYREALHAVEVVTGSFFAVLGPKLVLVCKDTEQKRKEQERDIAVMVPLPETLTTAEAVEVGRMVQQVMDLTKVGVDGPQRAAYLRGPASKVRPALRVFEHLAFGRAEVMLEVELFEVNESTTTRYGLQLSTRYLISSLAQRIGGAPLSQAWKFLGSSGAYGIGVGDAQLIASLTHNNSTSLQRSQVRTLDAMPAQIHVGDKFPIQTAGFGFGGGLGGGFGGLGTPPTVQFEDLGLTLKLTPRIHDRQEIGLEIEAEFKVLTGQAQNGIPVIASRKYTGKVCLRDGEWAVVAGLVSETETKSLEGFPVLRRVPGLGVRTTERRRGDTLLVIRPRVSYHPDRGIESPAIWVGPEGRLRNDL